MMTTAATVPTDLPADRPTDTDLGPSYRPSRCLSSGSSSLPQEPQPTLGKSADLPADVPQIIGLPGGAQVRAAAGELAGSIGLDAQVHAKTRLIMTVLAGVLTP